MVRVWLAAAAECRAGQDLYEATKLAAVAAGVSGAMVAWGFGHIINVGRLGCRSMPFLAPRGGHPLQGKRFHFEFPPTMSQQPESPKEKKPASDSLQSRRKRAPLGWLARVDKKKKKKKKILQHYSEPCAPGACFRAQHASWPLCCFPISENTAPAAARMKKFLSSFFCSTFFFPLQAAWSYTCLRTILAD